MTESDKDRYYKRVKERHFWASLGLILFKLSLGVLIIITVVDLIVSLPVMLTYNLIGICVTVLLLGIFVGLLFGRLGWSKSRPLDFLFNRLSIIFVLFGTIILFMTDSQDQFYPFVLLLLGVILTLLGWYFHSPAPNDPRIDKNW